jgi:hypothetical protein
MVLIDLLDPVVHPRDLAHFLTPPVLHEATPIRQLRRRGLLETLLHLQ